MTKFIKKLHLIFLLFFIPFYSYATPNEDKDIIRLPKLGDKLYLHAGGGNPQEYHSSPYNVPNIYELPNLVIAEKESIYKRPFQTKAISVIKFNNIKLTATLENFRDLKIANESGEILAQRKISGATSLFEVRSKGVPIAWGVGWHKYNHEYYDVDFTTFRVFVPIVQSKKIIIQERLLSLAQTRYEKDFKNHDQLVLVDASQIGSGFDACYYCFPNFLILDSDKGLVTIKDTNLLKNYINYDNFHDSFMMLLWLINKKDMASMRDYIDHHYDQIADNIKLNYVASYLSHEVEDDDKNFKKSNLDNLSQSKECMSHINNGLTFNIVDVNSIFSHCFPFIFRYERFRDIWIPMLIQPDGSDNN